MVPAAHRAVAPGLTLVHGGRWQGLPPGSWTARLVLTTVSTVPLAIGYALLVVAGMVIRGERPDMPRGVAWGAGGFVSFALAPALGVPPEIAGMGGGDIVGHQAWRIATACATAAGLFYGRLAPR